MLPVVAKKLSMYIDRKDNMLSTKSQIAMQFSTRLWRICGVLRLKSTSTSILCRLSPATFEEL